MSNAASFTIGAEVANARTVAVQLGHRGTAGAAARNVGSKRVVDMYLSSDAAGDAVVNAATTGIVPTAGADGSLLDSAITATKASFKVKTEADGQVDVVLTNAGDEAETVFLNVVLGNGQVATSGAIAFLDDTP